MSLVIRCPCPPLPVCRLARAALPVPPSPVCRLARVCSYLRPTLARPTPVCLLRPAFVHSLLNAPPGRLFLPAFPACRSFTAALHSCRLPCRSVTGVLGLIGGFWPAAAESVARRRYLPLRRLFPAFLGCLPSVACCPSVCGCLSRARRSSTCSLSAPRSRALRQ